MANHPPSRYNYFEIRPTPLSRLTYDNMSVEYIVRNTDKVLYRISLSYIMLSCLQIVVDDQNNI